jgi:hypothetical protein
MFSDDDCNIELEGSESTIDDSHLLACVSEVVVLGQESAMSMRFWGTIQDQSIVILLDSGSSHSFLSSRIADHLSRVAKLIRSLSIKVANGAQIRCIDQIQNAQWQIEGYEFCSDLKLLQLDYFDMILGYDWLEQFSPIKIHWRAKWLVIPYGADIIILHGVLSKLQSGDMVQIYQL